MAVVFGDAHHQGASGLNGGCLDVRHRLPEPHRILLVFSFDNTLYRQYLLLFGKLLVVRMPYELLVLVLIVGTAFSTCFALI